VYPAEGALIRVNIIQPLRIDPWLELAEAINVLTGKNRHIGSGGHLGELIGKPPLDDIFHPSPVRTLIVRARHKVGKVNSRRNIEVNLTGPTLIVVG
jgi:hypothetical protein